jgi:hypothetical protein
VVTLSRVASSLYFGSSILRSIITPVLHFLCFVLQMHSCSIHSNDRSDCVPEANQSMTSKHFTAVISPRGVLYF